MLYSVLLFDLDETLMDFNQDIHNAFFAMCREQHIAITEELFASYHEINAKWWDKLEKGLCTKPELSIGRFAEWTQKHGLQADPQVLNNAIFPQLAKQATLFAGAYSLIEQLSKTYTIHIVTNGNAASQHKRFLQSGLNRFCDRMFVSEEAGAAKPDRRYFDFVFSQLSVPKEKCLLIGDSLTSDIAGASGYGIDSAWYNPNGLANTTLHLPTYEIKTYSELLALLQN